MTLNSYIIFIILPLNSDSAYIKTPHLHANVATGPVCMHENKKIHAGELKVKYLQLTNSLIWLLFIFLINRELEVMKHSRRLSDIIC